jgi:hypothetical protein
MGVRFPLPAPKISLTPKPLNQRGFSPAKKVLLLLCVGEFSGASSLGRLKGERWRALVYCTRSASGRVEGTAS